MHKFFFSVTRYGSTTTSNVVWSVSRPDLLRITSTSNTSVSISVIDANKYGSVDITASGNICGGTFQAKKTIYVGKPSPNFAEATYLTTDKNNVSMTTTLPLKSNGEANEVCYTSAYNTYTGPNTAGATSYSWQNTGIDNTITWQSSNNLLQFAMKTPYNQTNFRFNATNSCGTTFKDYIFKSLNCDRAPCDGGYSYATSPNPNYGAVVVTEGNNQPCEVYENGLPTLPPILAINVYEMNDNVSNGSPQKVIQQSNLGIAVPYTFDISDLPNGYYVIEIVTTENKEYHKILLNK